MPEQVVSNYKPELGFVSMSDYLGANQDTVQREGKDIMQQGFSWTGQQTPSQFRGGGVEGIASPLSAGSTGDPVGARGQAKVNDLGRSMQSTGGISGIALPGQAPVGQFDAQLLSQQGFGGTSAMGPQSPGRQSAVGDYFTNWKAPPPTPPQAPPDFSPPPKPQASAPASGQAPAPQQPAAATGLPQGWRPNISMFPTVPQQTPGLSIGPLGGGTPMGNPLFTPGQATAPMPQGWRPNISMFPGQPAPKSDSGWDHR
jgi:hypothetical protein